MAKVDLYELGGRVLSVFGPFGARTLIELPTEVAQEMFPDGLAMSGRTEVVDAVERELETIRARSPQLAESAFAASAVAMGYEMQNPYNSATSKSMCARAMHDAIGAILARCPPEEKKDTIDEIAEQRKRRRAARSTGGSGA